MEKKDFLLMLGGVVFVVLMIFVWVNKTESQTAETTATVTSMGTGCGTAKTVVRFKYTVDGTPFENWTCHTNTNFIVNNQAKVCYDPSDPKNSSVVPVSSRCG